ncbi:TIR domain-containing protein, partial [candidate division KSB1 bacterium]|nr:TIR domain-containing protein [candidate division KSB1 bacterium]
MASENLIFISYARKDKDFAVKLAHDLLSQGVNIWLADFEIKAGDSWDMEVQKALTACISFLVVLSEASEKSKNVMDEVAYAIEEKKVIIPILFQKCNIHFRLRRLQHVDFTVDYDHGIQDLIESVRVPQETAPQEKDKRDAKKEKEDSINSLYREAEAATANKDWSAAKEKLQAVLELQPNHSKAKAGFEQVQEQMKLLAEEKELADLYSKGKEHLDARRFQKALEFFQKIQKIKADYKDVGALSTAAEQELLHVKKPPRKPPQIKPPTPLLKKILQQRGAIWIGSGFLLSLIVVTYMVFETDLLKKGPLAGDVSNDSLYVNLLQEGDALFFQNQYRKAKAKFAEAL